MQLQYQARPRVYSQFFKRRRQAFEDSHLSCKQFQHRVDRRRLRTAGQTSTRARHGPALRHLDDRVRSSVCLIASSDGRLGPFRITQCRRERGHAASVLTGPIAGVTCACQVLRQLGDAGGEIHAQPARPVPPVVEQRSLNRPIAHSGQPLVHARLRRCPARARCFTATSARQHGRRRSDLMCWALTQRELGLGSNCAGRLCRQVVAGRTIRTNCSRAEESRRRHGSSRAGPGSSPPRRAGSLRRRYCGHRLDRAVTLARSSRPSWRRGSRSAGGRRQRRLLRPCARKMLICRGVLFTWSSPRNHMGDLHVRCRRPPRRSCRWACRRAARSPGRRAHRLLIVDASP